MCDSLRMLMADCIDYAGVFPPAKLPLSDALHHFVRYTRQPEAWMLGRFVCPASLLPALGAFTTDLPFLPRRGPLTKHETEKVRQLVAKVLGVESTSLPETLSDAFQELDALGADSLDTVELMIELEDELNLSISEDPDRSRQLVESILAIRKNAKQPVAVVGTAVVHIRDSVGMLRQDIQALAALRRAGAKNLQVEALELKVPVDSVTPAEKVLDELICESQQAICETDLWPMDLYFEIACAADAKAQLPKVIHYFSERGPALSRDSKLRVGLKIRLGGSDPKIIPTADDVAHFIAACRTARVAWKATAGLHHAVSRIVGTNGAIQFGFLNVMIAGILGEVHSLAPHDMVPILKETSPKAFKFCQEALAWRELKATNSQIKSGRKSSIQSFGSCSFDEPRDALRELMLIP